MTLEYDCGVFQWLNSDAVDSTKTISGLSFQPKAIRFYWLGAQSASNATQSDFHLNKGCGFASSTSSRRSVAAFSASPTVLSNTGCIIRNDAVVCTTNGSGTVGGLLDITAFNSDGFVITVDQETISVNLTIIWEAWGGTDITDVTVGDFAEPSSSGTQNYTATGFVESPPISDQIIMMAGCNATSALSSSRNENSAIYFGFATSPNNNQIVAVGDADDATDPMDTGRYCQTGLCVSMPPLAGGNQVARAALTSFGTDQFTLNWQAVEITDRRSIYMAIKGGNWQVGSTIIDSTSVSNKSSISGFPFQPIGISFISAGINQPSLDTTIDHDILSMGCAKSLTSRQSVGHIDTHGGEDGIVHRIIRYDSVLSFVQDLADTAVVYNLFDLDNISSHGVRLMVDAIDTGSPTFTDQTSQWIGYIAFGNTPGALNFPSSPTTDEIFTTANTANTSYTFDGTKWVLSH